MIPKDIQEKDEYATCPKCNTVYKIEWDHSRGEYDPFYWGEEI